MASWGSVDFEQLKRLQIKLDQLERAGIEAFAEKAAKMLAARLLAKVIRRTPVGLYKNGATGGTLRRGWTAKSHREAELSATFGGGAGVSSYANGLSVTKSGNVYSLEIINHVNYARFVEFGHRTRGGNSFVPGRFMLTISADQVEKQAQTLLNKEVDKLLRGVFGG